MTAAALAPSTDGWLRRLAAGVALAAVGRGLALLGMAAFAALLPLDQFGAFAHGRALLTFLAPLATLGLAVTVMRRAPQYAAAGRADLAAGHAALGFAAAAASALPAGAAAWLWPGLDPAARWMIAGAPASGALFFGAQAARALERPVLAYLPLGLASLVAAAAFAAGGALGLPAGAEGAAAIFALVLTAAAVGQGAALRRASPPPRMAQAREWLLEAAPLAVSLGARGLVLLGPFLMLPLWAPASETGAYGLAWLVAQAALVATTGVSGACGPRLSAAVWRGDLAAARAAVRVAATAGGAAALAAGGLPALTLMLAPGMAEALRPGLSAAAIPLALLAAAAAVQAVDAPLGAALVAQGRGRVETATQLWGGAATLGAAAPLIMQYGAAGAAGAALLGGLVRFVLNASRAPLGRTGC